MSEHPIRIATRSSGLALRQAGFVADLLRKTAPIRKVELEHVSTTGDRDRTEALHRLGSVGLFTREVQKAVLEGKADLAVHSLKDLPTEAVEGMRLAAVPERGPVFDVLVLPETTSKEIDPDSPLEVLSPQARIGTGSLRRKAQLLFCRDDLDVAGIRGNVETRLQKLDAGEYEALILAEAGLVRLGLEERISAILKPPLLYPAVGQGALGIECRDDDEEIIALLASLSDAITLAAITAERSLLAELHVGCHAPLGVSTVHGDGRLTLEAVVLSHDGKQRLQASAAGTVDEADAIGKQVAESLKKQGADKLIEAARQCTEAG